MADDNIAETRSMSAVVFFFQLRTVTSERLRSNVIKGWNLHLFFSCIELDSLKDKVFLSSRLDSSRQQLQDTQIHQVQFGVQNQSQDWMGSKMPNDGFDGQNAAFASTSSAPRHTEEPIPVGLRTSRLSVPDHHRLKPKNTRRPGDGSRMALEPSAREWLVKCAAGRWEETFALLLRDKDLVQRTDFVSGFSVLHWAAKHGACDVVHGLMDTCQKSGTCAPVNSRSRGGHTPLHVAAVHGHTAVMVALVRDYGADVNQRDNSGRKAHHYLDQSVPAEVRTLLGGPDQKKPESAEGREQPKGLQKFVRLFQTLRRKRTKTRTKSLQKD